MDFAVFRELLTRATGITGDGDQVRIALAATGVLAARAGADGAPGFPTTELADVWPSRPLLRRWRDPTRWLEMRPTPAPGDEPYQEWVRELLTDGAVRLSIADDDAALDVIAELQAADVVVAAVSADLPGWASMPAARGPAWSWPLRLAIGPGWFTGPEGVLLDPPSWWDRLTVPVPLAGRWAEASLALLGDGGTGPGVAPPVRARAVIVRRDPTAPVDVAALLEQAGRHAAGAIAVVDPGPTPDRWVGELLAALSHDEPLDMAVHSAARFLQLPPPLVFGTPAVLERARLRTVVAGALRRLGPVEVAEGEALRADGSPVHVRRRDTTERLRGLASGTFVSEAGDASDAAAALTGGHADLGRSPDRYLVAGLRDGSAVAPGVLLPERAYQLAVRIGLDAALAAMGAPTFPAVDTDSTDGTVLTIVVTDLSGSDDVTRTARQDTLLLPRTGDSATVFFPVNTGPPDSLLELRVVVLHGQRFVQTGLLRARIGSTEQWRFHVESVVRADVEELAIATPHDAALVLNHTNRGPGAVTVMSPAGSSVRVSSTIVESVDGFTGPLKELVSKPGGFTGFDSDAYRALLVELARRGRLLHTELFGAEPEQMTAPQQALAAATRISVLCADPDTVIPLEFLYDRPLRTGLGSSLTFCPGARDHLLAGDCPDTPLGVRTSIVCPIRFWAASKIMERHVVPSADGSPLFAVAPAPDVERHAIPLGAVLAAAADRADHNDGTAWTTATAGMTDVALAASWEELGELAGAQRRAGTSADVVLLIAHVIRTAQNDIELELGTGNTWSVINDLDPVLEFDAARNPLMVLLGCGTAVADVPLFRPPARLLDCGAPAVVASLVTVLGRHIVPVAVRLLAELRRTTAGAGTGALLGEALLATRRACLLDGHAAVFALTVLGDTDWQLEAP